MTGVPKGSGWYKQKGGVREMRGEYRNTEWHSVSGSTEHSFKIAFL